MTKDSEAYEESPSCGYILKPDSQGQRHQANDRKIIMEFIRKEERKSRRSNYILSVLFTICSALCIAALIALRSCPM